MSPSQVAVQVGTESFDETSKALRLSNPNLTPESCSMSPLGEQRWSPAKRRHHPVIAEEAEQDGGGAWPPPQTGGFSCSLCRRLCGSAEQLREHEYRHTLSLMALSLDWPGLQGSAPAPPPPLPQLHLYQSLYRPAAAVERSTGARYLCSQCPASFTLKSNADRHEKTIHFKKKLMQCVYCLKHFRDRTDLHRHLSSVHSKERGHACPACAKAFSTQKNLATHIKVCCQAGAGPGGVAGVGGAGLSSSSSSSGMDVSQGGAMESLWQLSHEVKVDVHKLSINVEQTVE